MTRQELGDRLRKERKLNGLSQVEVADRLDTKRSTYAGYERGERDPNIEFLTAFCDLLKITMNDLLDEEKPTRGDLSKNAQRLIAKIMNTDMSTQKEVELYLDYLEYRKSKEARKPKRNTGYLDLISKNTQEP